MGAEGAARLWVEVSHHPAFLCGGWAWVLEQGGMLSGAAGGARNLNAEANERAALVAALGTAPKTPIVLLSSSTGLLALPVGDREVKRVSGSVRPRTPGAFALAWAELARDKAKAKGAFAAAIPKPNLAKIAGL